MRNMKTWKSLVVATLIVSMLTSLLALPLTASSTEETSALDSLYASYTTTGNLADLVTPVDPNNSTTVLGPTVSVDPSNPPATVAPENTENEGTAPTPAPIDPPAGGEGNDGGEGGSTAEPIDPPAGSEGNDGGEGGSTAEPTDPPVSGEEGDEGDNPTTDPIDPPAGGEGNDGGEGGSTAEPIDPPAGGEGNDGGEGGSTAEPIDPPAGDGEGDEGDDPDEPENVGGLIYTKNEAETEYTVTGYTGKETMVVIPATYEDLPVTSIAQGAFADRTDLESITLLSPQIEIYDAADTVPNATTIYGYLGSTAQAYAVKHRNAFIHMGTFGLVYTLNSSQTGYMVTDYQGTDVHIVIPESYLGLPVTKVVKGSLTNGNVGGSGAVPLPPTYLGENTGTTPTVPETTAPTTSTVSNAIQSVTLLSSTVELDGSKYTLPTGAVVYGYLASTAATYSVRFARTFVALDDFYFKLNDDCTSYELEVYKGEASEVVIPKMYLGLPVKSIGVKAFYNQRTLIEVTIPEGVTSIGNKAFADCSRMTSAPLPATLISIGSRAFDGCLGLTAIEIPAAVTSLASDAFAGCKSVMTITVDTDNTAYHSADNCLVETATKTLVIGCSNSVLPTDESVTTIGVGAFSSCAGMTELILSEHVTLVSERAFENYTDLMGLHFLSADTQIFDDASTISEDTVIYGYADSTAQAYAEKYGREFVEILLYTPGDIDGVEGVDVDDAIYLLFYTFYPAKYPVDQPCDFNHDGLVDVDDAIYLLFYTFYPAKYPLS